MGQTRTELLKAFNEDHVVLGRGFHQISSCLRAGDLAGARTAAQGVDKDAGAHIVFEEEHFYPALVPLLGEPRVKDMLAEHALGLEVVRRLAVLSKDAAMAEDDCFALLQASEAMEKHIAECGELFEAMGRIPESEQAVLLEALRRLRAQGPIWSEEAERPV